jgi:hypothetical protein
MPQKIVQAQHNAPSGRRRLQQKEQPANCLQLSIFYLHWNRLINTVNLRPKVMKLMEQPPVVEIKVK